MELLEGCDLAPPGSALDAPTGAALRLRRLGPDARAACRGAAEAFIRDRFLARYGARVRHFMPTLLQLETAAGIVQGAVGIRAAGSETLFLERYLDRSVEAEIAGRFAIHPPRQRIVEVGNLAARGAGYARLLIVSLTELLLADGFEWVVFTGTPEVLNSFRRLGLVPLPLAPAAPSRMGDELADWGTYYATHPQVTAGDIRGGHARLVAGGMYRRLPRPPVHSPLGGRLAAQL